jgi:hypothetical protein
VFLLDLNQRITDSVFTGLIRSAEPDATNIEPCLTSNIKELMSWLPFV